MDSHAVALLEREGRYHLPVNGEGFELLLEDVEIRTHDIPGWAVASSPLSTVALDLTLTDALKREGIARELVSRIQNLRKELDFEVTDRIDVTLASHPGWNEAITQFSEYIRAEVLARTLITTQNLATGHEIELDGVSGYIIINR
jgi:isoleucyl-tRNA synthetase